eukprot:Unigene6016_Nuclearia_a/m.18441 Unigene6016_Nuclearia_a/g.18441  ORF Unigene6016_Nuclearia_a/g.18441 Unigene6016_Nuclearia_a/m.18441 type:complete len:337 (-) Unigene6016_Nuclearia_a:668-1678(-)
MQRRKRAARDALPRLLEALHRRAVEARDNAHDDVEVVELAQDLEQLNDALDDGDALLEGGHNADLGADPERDLVEPVDVRRQVGRQVRALDVLARVAPQVDHQLLRLHLAEKVKFDQRHLPAHRVQVHRHKVAHVDVGQHRHAVQHRVLRRLRTSPLLGGGGLGLLGARVLDLLGEVLDLGRRVDQRHERVERLQHRRVLVKVEPARLHPLLDKVDRAILDAPTPLVKVLELFGRRVGRRDDLDALEHFVHQLARLHDVPEGQEERAHVLVVLRVLIRQSLHEDVDSAGLDERAAALDLEHEYDLVVLDRLDRVLDLGAVSSGIALEHSRALRCGR